MKQYDVESASATALKVEGLVWFLVVCSQSSAASDKEFATTHLGSIPHISIVRLDALR